jgi:hypothetical protein
MGGAGEEIGQVVYVIFETICGIRMSLMLVVDFLGLFAFFICA